jgi:uncharacterized phiE125 gp8 family phage protein
MSFISVTASDIQPVTLDFARRFARIDNVDDSDILNMFVLAATTLVERLLNKSLVTKTVNLTLYPSHSQNQHNFNRVFNYDYSFLWNERFIENRIQLPYGPVTQVNSVSLGFWNQADNVLVQSSNVSCGDYSVDVEADPARIWIHTPYQQGMSHIAVNYTAGYGSYASVPAPLVNAILIVALRLYEHRGDGEPTNLFASPVKEMMDSYRVVVW